MKQNSIRTSIFCCFLFFLLVMVDQFTKKLAVVYLMDGNIEIIPQIFSLHYLENSGAAWGLMQNAIVLFVIITLVVMSAIVFFFIKLPFERRYNYLRLILVLLASGAVGNFVDRVKQGYVIDFFYIEAIDFPVFNMADIFVCLGAILLIHALVFVYKEEKLI
ncbi:MAG: signal peptidase II [Eubacterium sp.]|nr:signal peptidase II [Eubacterium sp.]